MVDLDMVLVDDDGINEQKIIKTEITQGEKWQKIFY
jgi:hypothetical protein